MQEDIAQKDIDSFAAHLRQYNNLLNEHIKKEDTILFPWLDRQLSDEQKQEMEKKFAKPVGKSIEDQNYYEKLVQQLEDEISGK